MKNDVWIEHLNHWVEFLKLRLESTTDNGDREKIVRQLVAIERVRYSAVLNPNLLISFINPKESKIIYDERDSNEKEYCLSLNVSQRSAVNMAIKSNQILSLIQGPPGTGKTQVIAEICLQLYYQNPNIRILVCSETHVAVNNLVKRISEYDQFIKIVRMRNKEVDSELELFSTETIVKGYRQWFSEIGLIEEIQKILSDSVSDPDNKSLEKAIALSANIVGMTCNRVGAYRFLDTTEMFDYVIIDEACKATLPEILMPMIVSRKAILVGDPMQLPPVFCSEDIDIINAIEECNLQQYRYIDELFTKSKTAILLDTQYRMESSIGSMISRLFYKGRLINGRTESIENSLIWIDYSPSRIWPESEMLLNGKAIIRNLDEVSIVSDLLDHLDNHLDCEKSVAVISPYRSQVVSLRKTLHKYKYLNVSVDTVDGFQGKESDFVIFSITRTSGTFRFLADSRRLNVALSRARDRIFIIGYKSFASRNTLLKKIIDNCLLVNKKELKDIK